MKIQVQSYTRAGAYNSCFEVNRGRQLELETTIKNTQPTAVNTAAAQIREQMRAQLTKNASEIMKARDVIRQAEDRREVNPWLERTMWLKHLEGQEFGQMIKLVTLPKPTSSDPNERVLEAICDAFQRSMWETRKMIIDGRVSRFDLMEINSFSTDKSFSKPLKADILDKTFKNYVAIWQKLLCYFTRTTHKGILHWNRKLLMQTPCHKSRLSSIPPLRLKARYSQLYGQTPSFCLIYRTRMWHTSMPLRK
jgi:hypothetical protein